MRGFVGCGKASCYIRAVLSLFLTVVLVVSLTPLARPRNAYADDGGLQGAVVAADAADAGKVDIVAYPVPTIDEEDPLDSADPTKPYDLYVEYTDYANDGKVCWGEVTLLKTEPDADGVVFWFFTNPDKEHHAQEVQLSFIDAKYEEGKNIDLVIPETVTAEVEGVTQEYAVTAMGPESGTFGTKEQFLDKKDQYKLAFWYDPIDEFRPSITPTSSTILNVKATSNTDSDFWEYAYKHPLLDTGGKNPDIATYGVGRSKIEGGGAVGSLHDMVVSVSIPKTVERMGQCFRNFSTLEDVTFAPDSRLKVVAGGAFDVNKQLQELVFPDSLEYYQEPSYYRYRQYNGTGNGSGIGAYCDADGKALKDDDGNVLGEEAKFDDPDYGKWATEESKLFTVGQAIVPVVNENKASAPPMHNDMSLLRRLVLPPNTNVWLNHDTLLSNSGLSLLRELSDGAGDFTLHFLDGDFLVTEDHLLLTADKSKIAYIPLGLDTVVVPDSVTSLKTEALGNAITKTGNLFASNGKYCHAKKIVLGTGVTSLGRGVFGGNKYVEDITIPEVCDLEEWTGSGMGTFQGCSSLRTVDLGGISALPESCFSGCTSLENVVSRCSKPTFSLAVTSLAGSDKADSLDSVNFYLSDAVTGYTVIPSAEFEDTTLSSGSTTITTTTKTYTHNANEDSPFFKSYTVTTRTVRTKKNGEVKSDTTTETSHTYASLAKQWNLFGADSSISAFVAGATSNGEKTGKYYNDGKLTDVVLAPMGERKSLANAAVSVIGAYAYDGEAKNPEISVEGVNPDDYDVEHAELVDAGMHELAIVGKNAYFGSKIEGVPFTISPASLDDATATIAEQQYTGQAVEPVPEVSITLGDSDQPTVLTSDDFDVKGYSNNVLPGGSAKVTVQGKGNFAGTKEFTFAIASNEAYADDVADAKATDGKIVAIGEVTLASGDAIKAAEDAYGKLTDAQKALVESYPTLTAARASYDRQVADKKAADAAAAAIDAIGVVSYTDASRAAIDSAKDAYSKLTDAQKLMVANKSKLDDAEKSYAQLKEASDKAAREAEEQAARDKEAKEAQEKEAAARAAEEKSAREEAERQAAEKAAQEKAAAEAAAAQQAALEAQAQEAAAKAAEEAAAKAASTGEDVQAVSADGSRVTADVSSEGTATLTKVESASGAVSVNTITTADGTEVPVTEIAEGAFAGTDVASVTMGDSVETIGAGAFKGAEKLESVTVGKNVETIGAGAFSGCAKLTTVKLGKSVETIGASAFAGCTSLKSVTVPASTTSIGKNAFKGCAKLSSVKLGKNVKSVSAGAFKGAKKLKTLTLSTAKLTKASCKVMLKGSSVKTIKLTGMTKAAKKKAAAKYRKWFPSKVAGKKLVIK